MNRIENKLYFDYIVLFLLSFGIYVAYFMTQPIVQLNHGEGWDGIDYHGMYNYFLQGSFQNYVGTMDARFPFSQRPGVPFAAAMLGLENPFLAFKIVHAFSFSMMNVVLYFIWIKKLKFESTNVLLVLFWLSFHWMSIPRASNQYPLASIDAELILLLSLLLLWIVNKVSKRNFLYLILLSVVGTSVKEVFIPVFIGMVAVYGYGYYRGKDIENRNKMISVFFALIVSIGTNFLIRHYLFLGSGIHPGSIKTLEMWITVHLENPLDFVRYCVAMFTVLGAWGIWVVNNIANVWSREHIEIKMLALMFIAFGFVAGSDMERIMLNGLPFIFTVVLLVVEKFRREMIVIGIVITLPLMRLLSTLQEPANPLPNNDYFGAYSWYMEYANTAHVASWGIYMIISFYILARVQRYYESRH